jgi:hypothetical protein
VDEKSFMKTYHSRSPLTQGKLHEKFILKYETMFNWLCVSYDKKEIFWQNLKYAYERGVLDSFEAGLEEIVNTCMNVTRKYWKNQRGIAARKRRTELFQSRNFENRRKAQTHGWECFVYRQGCFKFEVLSYLRKSMIIHLSHRFEGREWEEMLLYSMASNSDLFGTGMIRFNEKQLYKKVIKMIDPLWDHLDAELMLDGKFYARFLALYASKMKRDRVKVDRNYEGDGLKKAQDNYAIQLELEKRKENARMEKIPKEHLEYNALGCEVTTACWKDHENKRYQKKRRKSIKSNGEIACS